jgi:hypothetical protein
MMAINKRTMRPTEVHTIIIVFVLWLGSSSGVGGTIGGGGGGFTGKAYGLPTTIGLGIHPVSLAASSAVQEVSGFP